MESTITNTDIGHDKPFIEANTLPVTLDELKNDHIIPVFTRDNTPLISQSELIELFSDQMERVYGNASDLEIRVSHPIKGRIPSARNKKAIDLLPHEKTLYYQRMMFIVKISNTAHHLNGQKIELIAGGIKAYNQDRIDAYKSTSQHFKLFMGMQVKVCANLSVFTDGAQLDCQVTHLDQLNKAINELSESYDPGHQVKALESWPQYALNEDEFAYFLGRCRLYHQMPYKVKKDVPEILLGDSQLSNVASGYFNDKHFKSDNGYVDLWSLYNLMTEANKSSYIDRSLDRNINASDVISGLQGALEGNEYWYHKQGL
jgi:hypothetical protein